MTPLKPEQKESIITRMAFIETELLDLVKGPEKVKEFVQSAQKMAS